MTATSSTSTQPPSSDPSGGSSAGASTVRQAARHHRPGWRDPRILVGVLIVAASVLAGVRILATADDTVAVWVLDRSLSAGTRVGGDDVRAVRIRFTSADQADRYLSASSPLPGGAVLARPIGEGELLPRAALSGKQDALVEVPVPVATDDLPATVGQGSVVDVWVTPPATSVDDAQRAVRVLDDVVVVAVPSAEDSLAPTGTRQVVVGVTAAEADQLGPALGRTAAGRVFLTRQG